MLLDEPFNGLDTTSRDVLVQVLTELKRQGAAIIVSTHDYSLAEQLCEQTAIVANGRITAFGGLFGPVCGQQTEGRPVLGQLSDRGGDSSPHLALCQREATS